MNKKNKMALLLPVVFVVTILACSINGVEVSTSPDLALTITAQALILQQNGQAPAAVNPPAADAGNPPAADNANPPAASVATSTATNTVNSAAGGPITVTVSVETNCRQGPNVSFPSVYSMSVSDVAEVIGKNTFTNYWIVKIPNGGGSICWLWGKYATIKGDASTLVEFATPTPKVTATATVTKTSTPTATITSSPVAVLTKPNAPSGLKRSAICTASVLPNQFDYGVSIIWVDNSNDENNFNVFTNSSLTPLGANTTSFNFTETYPAGTTLTISVTAQNGAGSSAPSTTTVVCP